MLDLHCHILPQIDDGARSWDDSFSLARLAVDEGITHILATPHHLNGKFENKKHDVIALTEELQQRLEAERIPLEIFPAQEVRLSGDILAGIENDEILFVDDGNRYLLIEFPTMTIPHYADQLFFSLQQREIVPVIVHPERNQEIIDNPNKLLEFVERGALAQLTASSYVGVFGKETAELSRQLIEANLVHFLASDAHNTRGRAFRMKDAFEKLEQDFGVGKVQQFHQTTKKLINGDYVQTEAPQEVRKKKKWFGLF
ncbi:tyrosine-protein phosphatase [Jeotgalibaca caeni]|uniref:tyrosine-protein phosphatase n=1 Tax=Jeotgalibaca caeni TaxID=3028623 RepID=UPI00237D550F|nr:CpsB/CapC family capsule biosynthesis tyrosine phosphatase [Jeotgalibaca caeni]MDE1549931.1 tyrosine protein phosphatase [Jeotgalibaca caeni]